MIQTIERRILKFIIKESFRGILQDLGRSVAKTVMDNFKAELKKASK